MAGIIVIAVVAFVATLAVLSWRHEAGREERDRQRRAQIEARKAAERGGDASQPLSTWDEMEFDREVYGHDWWE